MRALARIEARRLVRGTALPAVLMLVLGLGARGSLVDLRSQSYNAAFASLLMAAVTLVVSHRAVTRPRRDGSEELLEATPASARARTGGHLVAVLAPTVVTTAIFAVTFVLLQRGAHIGDVVAADVAVGPLLVAGAGCLGVLLARLWPQRFTPYLACVAIAFVELGVNTPRLAGSGARWLAFWVEGSMWWLLPRYPNAHLVYLVGLVAMAATGALLRHGPTRRLVAAGGASVAVTVAAAGVQMRQPQDHWQAANAMFAAPESVQRCAERDGVRYCTFEGFADLAGHFEDMVGGVRSVVPADAWPTGLEVIQRVTALDFQYVGDMHKWLPHVPDMPRDTIRQPDDGAIHPGLEFGWSPPQDLGFGVQLAARAAGLPLVPDPGDGTVCVAAGQARAALVLWLGAHATGRADEHLQWVIDRAEEAVDSADRPAGDAVLPVAEVDVYGGFAVALEDARLARRLLEADRGEVQRVVDERWATLIDPATSSRELAGLLGVDAPAVVDPSSPDLFVAHVEPDIVRLGAPCR